MTTPPPPAVATISTARISSRLSASRNPLTFAQDDPRIMAMHMSSCYPSRDLQWTAASFQDAHETAEEPRGGQAGGMLQRLYKASSPQSQTASMVERVLLNLTKFLHPQAQLPCLKTYAVEGRPSRTSQRSSCANCTNFADWLLVTPKLVRDASSTS